MNSLDKQSRWIKRLMKDESLLFKAYRKDDKVYLCDNKIVISLNKNLFPLEYLEKLKEEDFDLVERTREAIWSGKQISTKKVEIKDWYRKIEESDLLMLSSRKEHYYQYSKIEGSDLGTIINLALLGKLPERSTVWLYFLTIDEKEMVYWKINESINGCIAPMKYTIDEERASYESLSEII